MPFFKNRQKRHTSLPFAFHQPKKVMGPHIMWRGQARRSAVICLGGQLEVFGGEQYDSRRLHCWLRNIGSLFVFHTAHRPSSLERKPRFHLVTTLSSNSRISKGHSEPVRSRGASSWSRQTWNEQISHHPLSIFLSFLVGGENRDVKWTFGLNSTRLYLYTSVLFEFFYSEQVLCKEKYLKTTYHKRILLSPVRTKLDNV